MSFTSHLHFCLSTNSCRQSITPEMQDHAIVILLFLLLGTGRSEISNLDVNSVSRRIKHTKGLELLQLLLQEVLRRMASLVVYMDICSLDIWQTL